MTERLFEFEGNVTVEITLDNAVIVQYPKEPRSPAFRLRFDGFPNYEEAREFVLFGDFDAPMKHNEFLSTTGKSYALTITEV